MSLRVMLVAVLAGLAVHALYAQEAQHPSSVLQNASETENTPATGTLEVPSEALAGAQPSPSSAIHEPLVSRGGLLPPPPRPTPFRITAGTRTWITEARQRFQQKRTTLHASAEQARAHTAAVRSRTRSGLVKPDVRTALPESESKSPPAAEDGGNTSAGPAPTAAVKPPRASARIAEPKVEPKPSPFP